MILRYEYQCHFDGRPVRPRRLTWEEAAQDAVNVGLAVWIDEDNIKGEAEIYRFAFHTTGCNCGTQT